MGERRINPDTGVMEENVGLVFDKWEPTRNEHDKTERVNPETGIREEDQSTFDGAFGHKWESKPSESGHAERVNPETGIREEDQSTFDGAFGHKWEPKGNEEGHAERVNPGTGVQEEDKSAFQGAFGHKWEPTPNQEGRGERIHPTTGVLEEDQSVFQGVFGHKWESTTNAHFRGPRVGSEKRQADNSTGEGGYSDGGSYSGYTGGSGHMSAWIKWPLAIIAVIVGLPVVLGVLEELSHNWSRTQITTSAPPIATPGVSGGGPPAPPPIEASPPPTSTPVNPAVLGWSNPHAVVLRVPFLLHHLSGPMESGMLTVFSDGFELVSTSRAGSWQFWKVRGMGGGDCPPPFNCGTIQFESRFSGGEPPLPLWFDGRYLGWWSKFVAAYRNWAQSGLGREQLRAAPAFGGSIATPSIHRGVEPFLSPPANEAPRGSDTFTPTVRPPPAMPSAPAPLLFEDPQTWLTNLPKTTARLAVPSTDQLRITFDGPSDLAGLQATLAWDGQFYRGTTFRPGCIDGPISLRMSGVVLVGDIERPSCGHRGVRQGIVLRPPENSER